MLCAKFSLQLKAGFSGSSRAVCVRSLGKDVGLTNSALLLLLLHAFLLSTSVTTLLLVSKVQDIWRRTQRPGANHVSTEGAERKSQRLQQRLQQQG
jgi:hypothetical protein